MSTTSTLPASTPKVPVQASLLPTWVTSWETLIKAHERLIIVGILAIVGLHYYSQGLSFVQQIYSRRQTASQAALVTTAKNDVDLQKVLDAQTVQMQALAKSDQAKLTAIKSQIDAMTAAQAAAKLGGTAVDAITVSLPLPAAQKDTAALETLPIVQGELDSETKLADTQAQLITGLNKQLVDADNVCSAKLSVEKAKTKKALVRGLKIGGVGGFIAGIFFGHAI